MSNAATPKDNWIKLTDDGKFVCGECENEVEPETNSLEGIVKANISTVKSDLEAFSTKIIYAICPVCGMEYIFRLVDGALLLEPSLEEK